MHGDNTLLKEVCIKMSPQRTSVLKIKVGLNEIKKLLLYKDLNQIVVTESNKEGII